MTQEGVKIEAAQENSDRYALKYVVGELKNAFSGLSGFLNLLEGELETCKQNDLYVRVKYSLAVMNEVIKSMDSVIENNRSFGVGHFSRISLRGLLINCLTLLQKRAVSKEVKLGFDYDIDIPKSLYGNAIKLFEVVSGLLETSLDATSKGQVTLSVKLLSLAIGVASISIEIVNSGQVEKIAPAKNNGSFSSQGSDFKYIICEEILKRFGSKLHTEELQNGGTRLYFTVDFAVYEF